MSNANPSQLLLFADYIQVDETTFKVIPRKLSDEITAAEVCRVLKCSPQTLCNILNTDKGQELIEWRWQTPRQGKRLFDRESVLDYRKATQDPEFGSSQFPLI